jgi:coenzyme F420-reducing hydrogenase gamma subunit
VTSSSQGPLHAVLTAIDDGARSISEICRRTKLRNDVVTAALEHLERVGELSITVLSSGCPTGGCTTCASQISTASGDSAPGCGAMASSQDRRGTAVVAFTRRRT